MRPTRRVVLLVLAAAGCAPKVADTPLTARFAYPNGRTVQLDYADDRNFRLTDDALTSQTLIIDGQIYLHLPSSDTREEQVWRFGGLSAAPSKPQTSPPHLRPTLIPPQGLAHWGVPQGAFDTTIMTTGSPAYELEATVAKIPALARAQWVVATSLLPSMDMTFCGDAVAQVTRRWSTGLTGQGWAVLATSDGFRLDEKIGELLSPPALPAGVPVVALPF